MRNDRQSPEGQLNAAGATDVSLPSGPAIAARTSAQSSAERAMGPSLFMGQLNARAPVRGTKPKVGRSPVVPQRVEGDEIEPSVSDPIANGTHPEATALAG